MAQCDVQTLMNEAKCYVSCLTPGQMQIIKLQLLCNLIGGNVWYSESLGGDSVTIDAEEASD